MGRFEEFYEEIASETPQMQHHSFHPEPGEIATAANLAFLSVSPPFSNSIPPSDVLGWNESHVGQTGSRASRNAKIPSRADSVVQAVALPAAPAANWLSIISPTHSFSRRLFA